MAQKREIFSLLSTATGSKKMEPEEAEERLPSRANVFLQDLANSNGQNGELRKIKISLIDSKIIHAKHLYKNRSKDSQKV